MNCTKCKQPISKGQPYARTKKGPHHFKSEQCVTVAAAPAQAQPQPTISLTEATNIARAKIAQRYGTDCTMCQAGDAPVNGLHRGKWECSGPLPNEGFDEQWNAAVEPLRAEMMRRFSNKLSMEEIASFSYWVARPKAGIAQAQAPTPATPFNVQAIIQEARGLMKVVCRMIWAREHGMRIGRDDATDGSAYVMRLAHVTGLLPEINGAKFKDFCEKLTGLDWSAESQEGAPTPTPDAFDVWWEKDGRFYDPDFSEVPWFDKRQSLAEYAWLRSREAAKSPAQSAPQPDQWNAALLASAKLMCEWCREDKPFSEPLFGRWNERWHIPFPEEPSDTQRVRCHAEKILDLLRSSPVASQTPQAPSTEEK